MQKAKSSTIARPRFPVVMRPSRNIEGRAQRHPRSNTKCLEIPLFKRAIARAALLFSFSILSFTQACAQSDKPPVINQNALLSHVKFLSSDSLEGRRTGTSGNEKARDYLTQRFRDLNIAAFRENYAHKFSFEVKKTQRKFDDAKNIIGWVRGRKSPDKYLVMTAHYDHEGVKNGQIYNGADDNASGVAALLEIAAYFAQHPPENSIIFAALDAEELGLQGAKAFVENPPVNLEDILVNINLDMISRNAKNELYVCGTRHYPALKPLIEKAPGSPSLKVLFGHDDPNGDKQDWTFASDHGPFHQKKIPFVYFGVEDHEDYHKPTDDFEKIDPRFYLSTVVFILNVMKEFDANL